ncbi:hypothetical protein GJ496_000223 [Pomphorhynchus laevis]|nr:hypothetical protein GJ496_000223 [Pomphorhynchus laevis]
MVKRKITNHLAVLQSKMKRDPDAYSDEFLMQYEHLKASLKIFTNHTPKWNEELAELLLFIAHVSYKYPASGNEFVDILESVIILPSMILSAMRTVMLNCLMLLRRKNRIEPDRLYKILFTISQQNEASKSTYNITRKFIIRDIQLVRKNTKSLDSVYLINLS